MRDRWENILWPKLEDKRGETRGKLLKGDFTMKYETVSCKIMKLSLGWP